MNSDMTSPLLEIVNLSQSFDGLRAVDDVTATVAGGEVTALVGPNGAGKTTLFNVITGFLRPSGGSIRFGGSTITCDLPHRICLKGISRTFQDLRLFRRMTVMENVLLGFKHQSGESLIRAILGWRNKEQEATNREYARQLLTFVDLIAHADQPAEALSYGQQKLLSIATCLATDPKLLLLDEPVAGVQPEMTAKILSLLRRIPKEGKTVLFIEHNLDAVRDVAERVLVMDEGRIIAEGDPDTVFREPAVLEAYIQ